jgi:hypothetical protein
MDLARALAVTPCNSTGKVEYWALIAGADLGITHPPAKAPAPPKLWHMLASMATHPFSTQSTR